MNIYLMKKPRRFNSVSVTLGLLAAVAVYAVWALLPVMWPLWQMSGIMRTACAHAYSEPDDDAVMKELLRDARRTRLRLSKDNFLLERLAYSDEELRDFPERRRLHLANTGRACEIAFSYIDTYSLPLLGVAYTLPYQSTVTVDLRRSTSQSNPLYDLFYNSCTCTSVPPRS